LEAADSPHTILSGLSTDQDLQPQL
jgi:hypothetical protein